MGQKKHKNSTGTGVRTDNNPGIDGMKAAEKPKTEKAKTEKAKTEKAKTELKKSEKTGKRAGRTLDHALRDNRYLRMLCAAFVLAVFCVFPLVYHDYYYDILEFKCLSYTVMALMFLGLAAAVILCWLFADVKKYGGRAAGELFDKIVPWHWGKCPRYLQCLLAFWVFTALSTLCSEWREEAWTGSEGRYSGLLMISLYVLTTILVAAYGDVRRWFLDAFLAVSLFMAVFGITDYFRMDMLGFKAMEVGNPAADIFTSTIGNVNTYTGFLALPVGVAARILYFGGTFVFYLALFTGQSDNAYLALAALFCALPFFLWRNRRGFASYVLLIAGFATAVLLAGWWKVAYADTVIHYDGVIDVLMKIPYARGIALLLWAAGAGLTVWAGRESTAVGAGSAFGNGEKEEKIFTLLRRGWGIFLAVSFLAVVFVLFDANGGGHPERYEAIRNYVVFSDDWGVQRGFAWRIGWQEYKELSLAQKLLGSGPDTYGLLTESHWQEGIDKYGFYYESAHNEYFQYFVTIGPLATLAYLGFLAFSLWRMVKRSGLQPWLLAPCMAVLCYAAQAVVNISIPIAAAVMWAMMAYGLAGCRDER